MVNGRTSRTARTFVQLARSYSSHVRTARTFVQLARSYSSHVQGRSGATGNGQGATGNGQRATGNGQRATGNGQRATGNGQRATGKGQGARGKGQGARGDPCPLEFPDYAAFLLFKKLPFRDPCTAITMLTGADDPLQIPQSWQLIPCESAKHSISLSNLSVISTAILKVLAPIACAAAACFGVSADIMHRDRKRTSKPGCFCW